jgi:hypothetical protein
MLDPSDGLSIKFELRKLDVPAPTPASVSYVTRQRSFGKKTSRSPHYAEVVLGGVPTSSAGILGVLCGRKKSAVTSHFRDFPTGSSSSSTH